MNNLNFYNSNPQAIIFKEVKWSNLDDEINSFLKNIVCENKNDINNFCDKCDYCKKINSRNYFDLYEFNTYKDNFKKEDIINIQNQFLFSSIEKSRAKFCIIRGIENLNKSSINSLLKIIEEPKKNAYFIFSTRNIYSVYSTLKSRCSVINLAPNNDIKKEFLDLYKFDKNESEKIFFTYYSFNEFAEDFKSGLFLEFQNFAKNILKNIKNKDYAYLKKDLEFFKKINYYNIEKLFLYLFYEVKDDKKNSYLNFIDNLKFNLSKILIFNELLEFLE